MFYYTHYGNYYYAIYTMIKIISFLKSKSFIQFFHTQNIELYPVLIITILIISIFLYHTYHNFI